MDLEKREFMNPEKMGALIQKLRKEKGLTQKEVADKLHVTDRAVSRWERGIGCPDISLLNDLSNILDISISTLLTGSENTNEAIKDTINYVEETRKQKRREKISQGLIIFISFFLLVTVFNFLKIESRFYMQYAARDGSEYTIFIGDEVKSNDIFEDIEKIVNEISTNQGMFTNDDYQIIMGFVDKIAEEAKEAKKNFYKKAYSYQELDAIPYYEFLFLDTGEYNNYLSKIKNILKKYDSEYTESYNMGLTYVYRNEIRDYLYRIYRLDKTSKGIGEKVTLLLKEKYFYYKQILNSIKKVGKI